MLIDSGTLITGDKVLIETANKTIISVCVLAIMIIRQQFSDCNICDALQQMVP